MNFKSSLLKFCAPRFLIIKQTIEMIRLIIKICVAVFMYFLANFYCYEQTDLQFLLQRNKIFKCLKTN